MLSRKQKAFTEEYLIDLNGGQAAIRAGYSPRTATEQAWELLRVPEVADAVERGMAERAARVGVQQTMVLREIAHLALSDITHYHVDENTGTLGLTDGAPFHAMAAVKSVRHRKRVHVDADGGTTTTYETEVSLWEKPRMLFLLGRHVGLFADRTEHTGAGGRPLTRIERVTVFESDLDPGSDLDRNCK
jgi:phage terminase small subunit